MLLSIIIPIYNVEQYVTSCFESLFEQDLDISLYEIIAVNDGTPDNSMAIVEEYAEKYCNIRILQKTNGGVSSARNEGLRHAVGDFVVFVDPDDTVGRNSLSEIHKILSSVKIDILIMRSFFTNGSIERYSWAKVCPAGVSMRGVDVFKKGYSRGSVCGGAFNRRFLSEKEILFSNRLVNGEDSLFFHTALLHASYVRFFDLPFYYVTIRPGSASRSFDLGRIFNFSENLKVTDDYMRTHASLTDEQKGILRYVQYTVISSAINQYTKMYKLDYSLLKRKLLLGNVLPIRLEHIHTQRTKIRLLNTSFFLYFSLSLLKNLCKR